MVATITISDSALTPTSKIIKCNGITVSGSKNIDMTPNSNISTGPVEAQTQSFENLTYAISGVHYTDESGVLTWDDVLILYKKKYDGTNYSILNVSYGNSTSLKGLSGSTDIKVLLRVPSLPISATDTRDGYLPIGSLTFVETA